MAFFLSRAPQSPTTTQLAEGYSDSALQSKYDNHRIHQDKHSCKIGRCHHHDCSRPLSQFSGTSLGSKVRLSSFSLLDPNEHTSMLSVHHRPSVVEIITSPKLDEGPIPDTKLGKLKYYYDKYGLRHISPFFVLFLYSLAGAWLFFIVEHENEKVMKAKEAIDLNKLRNNTITRIITELSLNRLLIAREQLVVYEKELSKVKLPNSMPWDMWGSLFYVGTIFTTIGYGNIVPRTVLGRMLTVVYAIIGIPLVLAILSQFGRFLTEWVSFWWRRYRDQVKAAHKRTKQRLTYSKRVKNLENGISTKQAAIEANEEEEQKESSTIPIWLALLICVGWICGCAATFLLWEKRWNFFTSLYFFFVSLSTIGLGDVVPDNPHMLILMFWMVIIGLSIVSMLLSVIQIKMEEWLFKVLVKIQQEYRRCLAEGGPIIKDNILKTVMDKEGIVAKLLAPKLISEKQAEQIEHKAEQYERAVREMNNKNMQTEFYPQSHGIATQVENNVQSAACDVITIEPFHQETQWSKQFSTPHSVNILPLRDFNEEDEDQDSTSDATSLPMDTMSILGRKPSDRHVNFCTNCQPTKETHLQQAAPPPKKNTDCSIQTDIAQFQLDEIALRLAALQCRKVCPALVEKSMGTSIAETIGGKTTTIMNDDLLSEVIDLMSRSIDSDAAITKHLKLQQDGTTSTSDNHIKSFRSMRSMATSPLPMNSEQTVHDENRKELQKTTELKDESIQTWIPDKKLDMTNRKTSTMSLQTLIDRVTSPFKFDSDKSISIASEGKGKRKRKEPIQTVANPDEISEYCSAIGGISQSQQTSQKIPVTPQTDHWQQTSVHLTMVSPADSAVNQSQQTSVKDANCRSQQTSMCGPIPGKDQGLQTIGSSGYDQEQQTSQYSNIITNQAQQTSRVTSPEAADQSQQTSLRITSPRASGMHQSQQTSLRLTVPAQDGTDQYQQTSAAIDSYCSSCDARQGPSAHDHTDYASGSSDDGRITRSNRNRTGGKDKLGVKCRARSTSTSGMGNSIFDEDLRQEVIIQTDDSYLKIARRLDEYRSNRTQFLPVCAASPLAAKEVEPFKGDRPCDRRYDPKSLSNRKTSMRMRRRLSRTSASQTAPDGLSDGTTRSVSVDGGLERGAGLVRKGSLPAGIARGKVSDYIQKHEKGIHSPAKDRRKPIQIIRQYSMDSYDKGN